MAPEPKNPPELLLPPPLSRDARSRAFTAAADRMLEIDRTMLLVMMVDLVAPEVLPYLAQHFGLLGPPWRYLKTDAAKRKGIKEAIYWHRLKGSPAAVELALSWADYLAVVEDLDSPKTRWAEYELFMEQVPGNLPELKELADFAAPARAHLRRLHDEYNVKALIADRGRFDCVYFDNDSGAIDPETGLKLSFADQFKGHSDLGFEADIQDPFVAVRIVLAGKSRVKPGFIFDQSRWDSDFNNACGLAVTIASGAVYDPEEIITDLRLKTYAPETARYDHTLLDKMIVNQREADSNE